jgi:hypothetical protein
MCSMNYGFPFSFVVETVCCQLCTWWYVQHELWLPLQLCSWNSVLKVPFWIMGKSVYRWINHKCYNERRGWYLHSVSQWRAAIRGNTNMPTLFQLQSWRWIHNSCRTYKCETLIFCILIYCSLHLCTTIEIYEWRIWIWIWQCGR